MSASHVLKILLCFVMDPPQLNRQKNLLLKLTKNRLISYHSAIPAFDHPNLKMILCNLCTFPDKPKFRLNHKRTPLPSVRRKKPDRTSKDTRQKTKRYRLTNYSEHNRIIKDISFTRQNNNIEFVWRKIQICRDNILFESVSIQSPRGNYVMCFTDEKKKIVSFKIL